MRLAAHLYWILSLATAAAALVTLAWHYYPFYIDDAFISLRYADRLLEGKGLTWNDGERVEGYSNLLWTLLTSFLGMLGVELVAASRALCLISSLATLGAFYYFARRNGMHWLVFLAAALFFARSRAVALWSLGGLESSLHMALVAWILVLGWQRFWRGDGRFAPPLLIALLMGLVALNRPDGVIFTGLFGAMFVAAALLRPARGKLREVVCTGLLAVTFPLAQLIFRIVYYHDIFPNTYYAKVAFNTQRAWEGLQYVANSLYWLVPFLIVWGMLFVLAAFPPFRRLRSFFGDAFFLLLPALVWLAAVSIGGGDGFPGYRHLLPALPPLILCFMAAMQGLFTRNALLALLLAAQGLAGFELHQQGRREFEGTLEHRWEWKCKEVGERLRGLFAQEMPLVAVTAAGALPYYSKLPTLDMFGLNDAYLTRHRPKDFGYGYLGHELFNEEYVLSRRPDMIVLHDGVPYNHPMPAPEKLQQDYELRWLELRGGQAALWVRRDSFIYPKALSNTLPDTGRRPF